MLHGVSSAMRAIVWAGALMFGVLTAWSVLAVEILHPLNLRLAELGVYPDCPRCPRALASVMQANLTLFQTSVIGEDWGMIAIPIIEHHPWTAAIFLGVNFTVGVGLMSVILAVIVDKASEAREADLKHQAGVKDARMQLAKARFLKLCNEMDLDGSGTLSLDELLDGFEGNDAFRMQMQIMDVDKEDIECVFKIMDSDKSGDVSYHEFVEMLQRMKNQSSRTLLMFIKFYVLELKNDVRQQLDLLKGDILANLTESRAIVTKLRNTQAAKMATKSLRAMSTLEGDEAINFYGRLGGSPGVSEAEARVPVTARRAWGSCPA